MSESQPPPESRPAELTEAQEATLRKLCERYHVGFDPSHYMVWSDTAVMMPGWAEGWVGGYEHQTRSHTIYVGVSPEGEAHS